MSVVISKRNGKIEHMLITDEDVYSVMKSISYLIDLGQESGLDIQEFQNNEFHKALMLIMREF